MADQLDNRPVFTIVKGCNSAGKSAWKRANQDRLPERYFDKESISDGIGGWNMPDARERTDEYVKAKIDKALADRRNFGIESSYSGRPGRVLVERALEAGYRVEGIYSGVKTAILHDRTSGAGEVEPPLRSVQRFEGRVDSRSKKGNRRGDDGRLAPRKSLLLSALRANRNQRCRNAKQGPVASAPGAVNSESAGPPTAARCAL